MAAGEGDRRSELVAAIAAAEEGWSEPDSAIELPAGRRWLPDLEHADGRLLLVLVEELAEPWLSRLEGVVALGRPVRIASPPEVARLATLERAQALDAEVVIYEQDGEISLRPYASVADLVATEELQLERGGFERLAGALYDRTLAAASNHEKGQLFELVLCLMFSQVAYLKVLEHRYIADDEEIDIVLANRAAGDLGELLGGPQVICSAKNRARLRGSMGGRRGRCRFGILASARALAGSARREQVKATDDPTQAVALLDAERIRRVLSSADPGAELEPILREAVMR